MSDDYDDVMTRSGKDLLVWFQEVTEEIDGTPARLKALALRRRELARSLVQFYGFDEAAAKAGLSQQVLASLTWPGMEDQ
jgi:hypothetical protein